MRKKLLIFALSFCLGFVLFQILKTNVELDSMSEVENISSPMSLAESKSFQSSWNISRNSSALFEECMRKFKIALSENDRETVVSLINFPVAVGYVGKKNKPTYEKIKTNRDFWQITIKFLMIHLKNVLLLKWNRITYFTFQAAKFLLIPE